MLPLICFETGRNTQTQSCWAARRAAPANGCLVLFTNRNRGREANTTRWESQEITPALLPSASGGLFASWPGPII